MLCSKFLSLLVLSEVALAGSAATLLTRSDCTTQTVISGDSCASLATRCNISGQDLSKYNADPKLCSTLTPGQRVCCSSGSLPDITPKAGPDGVCATYTVKSGDTCASIAAANGLKVTDLSIFNDGSTGTWGWYGCDRLMAGINMCLSTGKIPMPAPMENAICGPTVPGTQRNSSMSLDRYNPCPLNACCDVWGQCGITEDFCIYKQGPTKNPGTSPEGISACVTGCDAKDPISKWVSPKQWMNVGYFESWTYSRPCLNMRVSSIDTNLYTHVHWAFGTIGEGYQIYVNDTEGQWSSFVNLQGVKKVLSFGGWEFSTSPSTYHIFRDGVKPENADHFATMLAAFIMEEELDGIDIDWEYPGAPDLPGPGYPAGSPQDGLNYLKFLQILRTKLRADKTISIAAPASYWYLKQYPIHEIAEVVDYIVYMTYDLHGQWDFNNKWSQAGCSGGNCLRSHVNLTETMYALTMITKAPVVTSKIVVGLPSYGRAFAMTQTGCTGPDCTYAGPESSAAMGECTQTRGILANAEIEDILATAAAETDDNSTRTWYDYESNSNIAVFNNTWVAYIDEITRGSRSDYYKSMNFLGTVDWTMSMRMHHYDDENIDIHDPPDDSDDEDDGMEPILVPPPNCTATFSTIEAFGDALASVPEACRLLYTVQTLKTVLDDSLKKYQDLMNNDYDNKFQTYAQSIADHAAKTVTNFTNQHGEDYFTCTVVEASLCCDHCSQYPGANPCAYCNQGQCFQSTTNKRELDGALSIRDHPHTTNTLLMTFQNQSEPCPPNYSQRGAGSNGQQSIYWTFKQDKVDKFYADLSSNTSIAKDKIKIGNVARHSSCDGIADPTCWDTDYDFGFPYPDGYRASDVSNPKDIVTKALANSNDLQKQLGIAIVAVKLAAFHDTTALIDAVSVPVLMIADAVASMDDVEKTAEQIDEAKRKEIILAFLGALLFFIPVAGEALGAVTGIAAISSVLTMVAVAGDVAFGIYSLVEEPGQPLQGILSIVMAPLALGNIAKVDRAAEYRRGMGEGDLAKLGGKIGGRLKILQKFTGVCMSKA